MSLIELVMIAVGLSMDAFAVSVCKGLSVPRVKLRHALLAGLYFGGFQFLMPVIGWLLGGPVGIGTILCAFDAGPIMQLAFRTVRFDATTIRHQNLRDSFRVIFKRKTQA